MSLDPVLGAASARQAEQGVAQVFVGEAVSEQKVVSLMGTDDDLGVLHAVEGGFGQLEQVGSLVEGKAAVLADLA
jgi:hypothetical protein